VTVGLAVFLLGLFGVPLVLLGWGHRIRRRGPASIRMFRWVVVGHIVAALVALTWGMLPPEAWAPDDRLRGFAGFFGLLLFPGGAALLALVTRGRTSG
jgi:hypothetical protein